MAQPVDCGAQKRGVSLNVAEICKRKCLSAILRNRANKPTSSALSSSFMAASKSSPSGQRSNEHAQLIPSQTSAEEEPVAASNLRTNFAIVDIAAHHCACTQIAQQTSIQNRQKTWNDTFAIRQCQI